MTRITVTTPIEVYPELNFEKNLDLTVKMTGSYCSLKAGAGFERLQNTGPDPAKAPGSGFT